MLGTVNSADAFTEESLSKDLRKTILRNNQIKPSPVRLETLTHKKEIIRMSIISARFCQRTQIMMDNLGYDTL